MELQEKMELQHSEALCKMLGVKELPENLIVKYLALKKLTDKIDVHIGLDMLALIVVSSSSWTVSEDGKTEFMEGDVIPEAKAGDDELAVGQVVYVKMEGDLREGKIVGRSKDESQNVVYQVEVDGERLSLTKDDLEYD